MELYN